MGHCDVGDGLGFYLFGKVVDGDHYEFFLPEAGGKGLSMSILHYMKGHRAIIDVS